MRDLSALPNLNVALIQTTLAWHDRQANLQHSSPCWNRLAART